MPQKRQPAPINLPDTPPTPLKVSYMRPQTILEAFGILVAIGIITLLSAYVYTNVSDSGTDIELSPTPTIPTPTPSVTGINNSQTPAPTSIVPSVTTKPQLSETGNSIVFLQDNSLLAYNPATEQSRTLVETLAYGGNVEGIGFKGFQQSSDFQHIAYTGTDGAVYVVDVNGLSLRQITTWEESELYRPVQSYLTGWSPDGTKLLYYIRSEACRDCIEPVDTIDNPSVIFGFHIYDLVTGGDTFLFGVNSVVGWGGDSQSIYYIENEDPNDPGSKRKLIKYTLKDSQSTTIKNIRLSPSTTQFAVSKAKPVLVYTQLSVEDEVSYLTLLNIDQATTYTIYEGNLGADYRGVIDPTGFYVLYQDTNLGSVYRFDMNTQQSAVVYSHSARIIGWWSNYEAILVDSDEQGDGRVYSLKVLNILNNEVITIAENITPNFPMMVY